MGQVRNLKNHSREVAPVVDSVLELVGNTPLIDLSSLCEGSSGRVLAKAEHMNPGGSVKDRPCLAMLEAAERNGLLGPGGTVVEPTSGNTGIALAIACAVRGYRLILTMPESMSLERRQLLEAYGADLVLTPAERVMEGAIEAAERIMREEGAWMPQQFRNPANPAAHESGTAEEVFAALGNESLAALVVAVGTGGTLSGLGRRIRERYPRALIVAVEPAASPVLAGGQPGPTKLQGIGAGFVPDNYDASMVDRVMHIEDNTAYAMKERLAQELGLLVGITAAANVAMALEVAREFGADEHVLTVLCDTGERYFSLDEYFRSTKETQSL